jgi:hypothetical protein
MRNEQLSTADFVATGDRNDVKEIPIHSEDVHETETIGTYGVGGARMVKEMPPPTPLFVDTEGQEFRSKWDQIQIAFVDEPRKAVQDADNLVAQAMKRLAEIFSDERKKMESQWDKGDDVSTEDLRVALQRYRSFFNRLLAV